MSAIASLPEFSAMVPLRALEPRYQVRTGGTWNPYAEVYDRIGRRIIGQWYGDSSADTAHRLARRMNAAA